MLPCIAGEIDRVMNAALGAVLSHSDLKAYHAARSVFGGLDGKSDAEKQAMWAKLCISQPPPLSDNAIAMLKNACGVFMGVPCSPADALGIADAFVAAAVDTTMTMRDHLDAARVRFAFRIILRRTMLINPTLETVLACVNGEVDDRLREAHHLMFPWEMRRMSPDGTRRVPVPWVADLCKTTLRLLDDLMNK